MTKELILQGLTARTHVDAINEMFAVDDLARAIISVAFVSESGVNLLADKIAPHANKFAVFAGIRNEITSAQAMRRLLSLGVSLYAVDTGSRTLIFHPKIYYVRSGEGAAISVGSANLTLGGLNNNVEAGVVLKLTLDGADGVLLSGLESQFDELLATHPENVIAIASEKVIDDLLASGRLADEASMLPPRPTTTAKPGSADPTPRMKLQPKAIRSTIKKPQAPAVPMVPVLATAQPAVNTVATPTTGVNYDLLWVSKALERRDLNIPVPGYNTNATGSINLDKGIMEDDVDHRHYFREEVFSALDWPTQPGQVDTATATFAVTIKGVDHGTHELTVRHTTSTTSKTYKQRNAMTRLSWGGLKAAVGDASLLGRHMALYRDSADPTRFMLEID